MFSALVDKTVEEILNLRIDLRRFAAAQTDPVVRFHVDCLDDGLAPRVLSADERRYKIYVDAGRPATLNDGAGVSTDCTTLQDAVLAWHRLAPEQKIRATVRLIGGPAYTAQQISRLHYGPKPAA
jgi:hypothetical protein